MAKWKTVGRHAREDTVTACMARWNVVGGGTKGGGWELWGMGKGSDRGRTDLWFRECPLVACRGHCREIGLEAGRPAGTKAVQVQDQDGAGEGWRMWWGAKWPRGVREGEGGVCGNLPLGVLGKGTRSLVMLVTKMDPVGSGEQCAQYWTD